MQNSNRKGIIGGSFNPVHLGHLRAAEVIREHFSLDKVLFIPAAINPQKSDEEMADPRTRYEMLRIATEDNPFFDVSDIELKREGPSYTIDTLSALRTSCPENNNYFIMGSELFSQITTWKRYDELFNYSNFIVVKRPGTDPLEVQKYIPLEMKDDFRYVKEHSNFNYEVIFEHKTSHKVHFITIQGYELSSTMIRNLLIRGSSIKYLVPDKLEQYIKSNNIYTEAT